MRKTKRSLLVSAIALTLCFAMLMGTTYAWFTDSVTSSNNIIKSGNLDLEVYWTDDLSSNIWNDAEDTTAGPVFNYDRWEPGYTSVRYIKIVNAGNLAFKYSLNLITATDPGILGDVIDVYYVENATANVSTLAGITKSGTLNDVIKKNVSAGGVLLPEGQTKTGFYTGDIVIAIALHMQEGAGNEYQNLSVGGTFDIQLVATQYSFESDAFGTEYDTNATFPEIENADVVMDVPMQDGKATENTNKKENGLDVTVQEGTLLDNGKVSVKKEEVKKSEANVQLGDNEEMIPLNVHADGVSANNTVPLIINLGEVMPKNLNIGNYALYHVENGVTNQMTAVSSLADLDEHNEFYYDLTTGEVTVAMATFSEVALVADTENAWEGNFDYNWYDADADQLYIANADQLAAFGAIVGGMKKVTGVDGEGKYTYSDEVIKDSFKDKTVTLTADINLGDDEKNNNSKIIFYPIGYYNSEGTYERTNTAITSGLRNFEGTFDGNGHTVANFYQNTWEMKGDHNWYDATLQYYRDGMGLFGRVYKGTVKNLTVKNFSSDGEITTTGVIAAYADGATFENIAIFNCNPRVYNIGNGGIVGCVGWYAKEANLKTTFKNITVDNTNKISALWGSYDVACGGIVGQYYPTSGQSSANYPVNAGIYFENCHVSAQMDVYNDVCANYQYYAYRYTGMLIGSVRENVTIDGHVYPKMDGITASGCTVHFGTWNDYYYCEIIDNTTASYTHDYQMSRLTEIKAIDGTTITYLDGTTGTVPASGRANYVIVDYTKGHGTENATCYHFKDGAVWTHDMGGIQTGIDENGDGQDDLKEDKQHIYLEFNNLVTGYGWGVTTKGVGDLAGVTILDREEGNSVEKFEVIKDALTNNRVYKLGDIFKFVDNGVELVPGSLTVGITNLDENGNVSAEIVYDRDNWANSTIVFTGSGKVTITIQDYYFCTPTELTVNITERQPEVKFDVVMNNGDFLHRVGNVGTVALDKLFKAKDGAEIGTISVTVDAVDGTGASGTYSNNAIQFSGTGVVKVTITDNDYCIPTTLILEVVEATNVTGLSGTVSGNVVLLNNCVISSLTVSGRNTVYGNGFTATYSGNGQYLRNGLKQGVITVSENGTLDNLRIKATIYPVAYMYYNNAAIGSAVTSGPYYSGPNGYAYYYQLSAVAAKDNATITNCYIYGGRNNIFVDTGDVTIKDTILECGVVANVQIQSNDSHTITLENVTTIQHKVNATIDDASKVMMGAGIIVGPETNDNPTLVLNGEFKQYNWVNADDETAVSDEAAKTIIGAAVDATAYNHTIDDKVCSNLGIIYMNDYNAAITNNTGLPYKKSTLSISAATGQVYSPQGATESQIYSDYASADRTTENGLYQPQFKYPADLGGQHVAEGGDEHCYREGDTIKVMFISGDIKEIDLAKLVNIAKYGNQDLHLAITCVDSKGNSVTVTDGKITLSAADEYTITYTVTDTLFYDKEGNPVSNSIEYSWDVSLSVSLKDKSISDAYFAFDSTKQIMGYGKKSGLSALGKDNFQYLPFLAGLQIYDYNGQTAYLRFDGNTDFSKIAKVELTCANDNAYVTVTLTDGGVIDVVFTGRAASGSSTKTGSIKTSGNTVYYLTDGDTAATTTTWTINSYTFIGNNGVEIKDTKQVFSNCVSGTLPSGSFSTTINYTVNYDSNGGNCGQTTGYATSASAAVTLPTPTRSGYIFAGWYTAASGGTRVGGAGDSYTPSANITLYAQWGKPCTVTYNANGGSCGTASGKYTGTALTLPTPTRDGYWFIGWYDAAEGGNKIGDAGETYNPSNDITLYAHWQQAIEYTVTYNANGGSCGTASATYEGTALTLPTPTRTGYTFKGWYTAASGGTKIGDAGASYIPSENITLYAQWTVNSYTIKVTTNNATVKVNGIAVNNNGTVSIPYGTSVTVDVTYTQSNSKSTTIKGTDGTTYTSPFNMPAQEVTINATSSGSCVTGDTLVTLADGTQKRVDELTFDDKILAWDFFTGKYVEQNISILVNHGAAQNDVIYTEYSDGTLLKFIGEHGIFDYDLNKFVYITAENAQEYVGHRFVKQNLDGGYDIVTLTDVYVRSEYVEAWSITSAGTSNAFAEGMLTVAPPEDFYNWIEMSDKLLYDVEQFQKDVETYGLYTYEDFADYVTYEQFVDWNGAYLKVAVEKGYFTYEYILELIELYKGWMPSK